MTHHDSQWRAKSGPEAEPVPEVDLASTIHALRAGLRRQWRLIAVLVTVMTALALVYIALATPKYTARAEMIVDPRISNSLSGPEAPTLLLSDALVVDSELKVLSSREVTMQAADALGLFDAPAEPEEPGLFGNLMASLRDLLGQDQQVIPPETAANTEATRREIIRRDLMEGFDISRDGGTYVIDIAYTSDDPVFAMTAVNTLIDAYFRVSSDASLSDTRRISTWLDQRVEVLAAEVQAADLAVTTYRRENDLFTMRDDILPSEAELSDATDRLIRLRSDLIETRTMQEKIEGIVAAETAGALMDGTLGGEVASPALRDIQTRFAGLVSEERDLISRFGANSDVVARNREDQDQMRQLMLEEASQIALRLVTQQEATRREILATEAQVEELRARTNADAEKSIRLRELERDANAKRELYDSMLQEMISATQRETFQRAPARVIARAVPPDQVSSPNAKRLLVLTVFAGLVLGAALGFLREVMDNRLRRVSDLRDGLGLRWLGLLPRLPAGDSRLRRPSLLVTPPDRGEASATLRGLIAELQQRKPDSGALITGIGAVSPGAGRAGLTGWLSRAITDSGSRVAVLDLDASRAGLSRQLPGRLLLGDPFNPGTVDADLDHIRDTWREGEPLILALPPEADILTRAQQRALAEYISALRPDLDHLLVILPPLCDRAEADTAAALTDATILALRWGETTITEASEALAASTALRQKLLGAVFTTDKPRAFLRYNR